MEQTVRLQEKYRKGAVSTYIQSIYRPNTGSQSPWWRSLVGMTSRRLKYGSCVLVAGQSSANLHVPYEEVVSRV